MTLMLYLVLRHQSKLSKLSKLVFTHLGHKTGLLIATSDSLLD